MSRPVHILRIPRKSVQHKIVTVQNAAGLRCFFPILLHSKAVTVPQKTWLTTNWDDYHKVYWFWKNGNLIKSRHPFRAFGGPVGLIRRKNISQIPSYPPDLIIKKKHSNKYSLLVVLAQSRTKSLLAFGCRPIGPIMPFRSLVCLKILLLEISLISDEPLFQGKPPSSGHLTVPQECSPNGSKTVKDSADNFPCLFIRITSFCLIWNRVLLTARHIYSHAN